MSANLGERRFILCIVILLASCANNFAWDEVFVTCLIDRSAVGPIDRESRTVVRLVPENDRVDDVFRATGYSPGVASPSHVRASARVLAFSGTFSKKLRL